MSNTYLPGMGIPPPIPRPPYTSFSFGSAPPQLPKGGASTPSEPTTTKPLRQGDVYLWLRNAFGGLSAPYIPTGPVDYPYPPGRNVPPAAFPEGPSITGDVSGGGGGAGYGGLLNQNQIMLANALAMLQQQMATGRQVITDTASAANETAMRAAEEIEQRGAARAAEAEQNYLGSAEAIAARESEIAAAAGSTPGMAGVYVAPGGTEDWEMMMRSAASRASDFASNLATVSANDARMAALEATNLGVSYVGALTNIVAMLSFQAQQAHDERAMQIRAQAAGAGGGGAGAERVDNSAAMNDYLGYLELLQAGQVSEQVFAEYAKNLRISPQRIIYDLEQYRRAKRSPTPGRATFIPSNVG